MRGVPAWKSIEQRLAGRAPKRATLQAKRRELGDKKVLAFLAAYHSFHNAMPLMQEVADHMGWKSEVNVYRYYYRLAQAGFLEKMSRWRRGWRITLKGWAQVGMCEQEKPR
jgi:hypothetical protein